MPHVPFGFVHINLPKCQRAIYAAWHLGVHLHSSGAYTRLRIFGLAHVNCYPRNSFFLSVSSQVLVARGFAHYALFRRPCAARQAA